VVNLAKNKKNKEAINGTKGLKVYKVETAQQKEQARMRKEKNIHTFLIVVIIILAIAAVFSAIHTFFPRIFYQQNFITNIFGKFSLSGELAARVNGVRITEAQLNDEYARLPVQYQYFITKEVFLQQLIDEVLLSQEASKQGLSVSEAEIDENLNTFMQENNLTQDSLNELLVQKQMTYEQLRSLVQGQLLIDKVLQQEVKSKVNVTSAEALQYYNDNPNTFKVPETVTARHILIGLVNRTPEQAKEKALEVLQMLKDDNSNFCELVTQYSDDSGSLDNCGEYTFPKGQMVPEFETAAFEQGIGQTSLVNTTYGYHIIWTVNMTPEKVVPFADVEDQIITVLGGQQEKMIYSDLIAGLRADANIVNYYEQEQEKQKEEAALENKTEEQPEQATGEAAATTQVNVVAPEESTEMPDEEEISQDQQELEAETEKAVEEVIEEEEPAAEAKPVIGFTDCLKKEGAVLYGAYWDSSTNTQKELFGMDAANIDYVECGVQGDYRAQAEVCRQTGIQAYPTWVIGSEKYMGILEIKQLETMTGCKA
jgi:parvulin-like peptidyl-prolyl isomerase